MGCCITRMRIGTHIAGDRQLTHLAICRVARLLSGLSRSSVGGPLQFVAAALTTRTLLLIHALFTLCVLVNLLGCIWWNVAETEGLENSWAAASECGRTEVESRRGKGV